MRKVMKWIILVLIVVCIAVVVTNVKVLSAIKLTEEVTRLNNDLDVKTYQADNLARNLSAVNNLLQTKSELIPQINDVLLMNGYGDQRRVIAVVSDKDIAVEPVEVDKKQ